ncbi:tetratricopeptide repeat protein [Sphingopyxis alaskensis]|jgi:cytochrome c-type biogenesis protein CcmH|uniref:TPR repeat n=1 Tax=Sphingopyxis alaskensis (strain DSM 13593 / LMG 18877 / RB2256) TaxID=317655 RepID=Q1GPE5_SPHAL|nr:tetratricopeptide repeat protein [Sphingopyxis alaskensis]ABF54477.1 TPR repeat [Sphingopyxis alaskensis RB2256]
MSESNGMQAGKAVGLSRANRAILIAAFVLLAAAVGYAIWRDSAPAIADPAIEGGAAPGDQIAALEARVQREPDSADAWTALGAARFDMGNFVGAAAAYEKAVALSPESAGLWSALGEARVMASERDPMPAAAVQAFDKAIALDARDPRARYFLAVKKDIGGDHKGAIEDWFALLADTPQGAPWEADLRRTIEQVGAIHKIDVAQRLAATRPRAPTADEMPVAARAIPGPSRAEMEAAAQLPKGQQDAMIAGMVDGLEAKLRANPADVDRWIMLMRSRMTLGETAKAAQALKDGIAANPAAAGRLKAQAQLLGVPGA